jgi:excinuclease ABC subunit C
VGPGRKKALLRHFGSLKRVREASIEELAQVEGVSVGLAERIHAALHAPQAEALQTVESGAEDAVRQASLEDASAAVAPCPEPASDAK